MMQIPEIAVRMIEQSGGDRHDIAHFLKVYAYAQTIGLCEGLDASIQTVLEAAAVRRRIVPLPRP